ncbi:hypothetical protein ODZ83_07660 [Acaricomes phytoseiuli]|uniref:hypothetical protein n=1 Tax=Acaricomes phytoseiuli TaxID=291968 RepID=UPI0003A609EC|nr:hypothetical protein [Acaricomes phytoseiuli]MCW1250057.1 hypothetical protein [Acaricomes phytoseiuli]
MIGLPEALAVCGVYPGPMPRIRETWQQLDKWALENGCRCAERCQEFYVVVESAGQQDQATELQQLVPR